MKNRATAFAVLVFGLFILLGFPCFAAGDSHQLEDQGFDIVLLMDCSGSMKKTDPRNYRKEAARLFISLLGPDDKVSLVSFGDSAKTLIPLTPDTKGNRTALFNAAGKITSKEFSTDITGAIKKGVEELQSSGRKKRALILMSDGKLALGDTKKDEASLDELMKLLPELNNSNIKIYSIAFSELSDPKLLGNMSEKTGGFFRYAATDKDIHVMFASIFEKIKSPDSVALEGDTFTIDKDVKEAVLLITKQAGTATVLMDPSGKKIIQGKSEKNVQWYSSGIFDMITIQGPMTGKWKVRLSSREGNRIFVLTNLKLKSSFEKNTLNKGDKVAVDAWLEKDDKRISDREVLEQVKLSAEVIGADGKGVKIPLAAKAASEFGIYAGEISADRTGDFTFKLTAEGKTFNRSKELLFKVAEPSPLPAIAAQGQTTEKAVAASQAPVHKDGDIDWGKTMLVLGTTYLALISLAVILFLWGRRYRKLYLAALSAPLVASAQSAEETTVIEVPAETPAEEVPAVEPSEDIETALADVADETIATVPAEIPVEGPDVDSVRIKKLLGIIEFQKGKIAELMLVKEMLGNARQRLGTLPARGRDMQDRVRAIAEAHGLADELKAPLSAGEDDAGELMSYIMVLGKEEERLADKFRQWEDELNKLMEGEEYIPPAVAEGSAVDAGMMAELEAKLTEMENQLMSKDRKMKALEHQYEDIEKEYMVLYQQQQKQQPQQPDI